MKRREKLLLGVLITAPKIPSKIEFVKWMFLLKHETTLSNETFFYDFVPYQYGPFSFTLYKDINELSRSGYLVEGKAVLAEEMKSNAEREFGTLPKEFRLEVMKAITSYSKLVEGDLIRYVYDRYPWYASRSKYSFAPKSFAKKGKIAIYTSGYEGISVDSFFHNLLRKSIKCLIDVRKNPISRKYGFSKNSLQQLCNNLDLKYHHFPQLGIPSSKRYDIHTDKDYQKLFDFYEKKILLKNEKYIEEIRQILVNKPSVLMCFEKSFNYCHRYRLAKKLASDTNLKIINI